VYLHGLCDRDALVGDLGSYYEMINLSFKPWPACAFAHPYIDAMLSLRAEHSLRAEDIDWIDVFHGEVVRSLGLCNPIDIAAGKFPKTENDGKRSIPFNIALAALKGKISLRDFNPEGLGDIAVLKIAGKVRGVMAPELDEGSFTKKGNQLPPGIVGVTMKNGQSLTRRVDIPYGHHHNPMKFADLIAKFRDCIALAPGPISEQDADRIIDMILNLEKVADIGELLRLLA
jgi:2-methylcitrate dehydratase PrpD